MFEDVSLHAGVRTGAVGGYSEFKSKSEEDSNYIGNSNREDDGSGAPSSSVATAIIAYPVQALS